MHKAVTEIDLGRGYVAKVYSDTYERMRLGRFKWHAQIHKRAGKVYANNGQTSLHRLITRAKPGEVVDHLNGDTLDNRDSNLKACTSAQNRANSRRDKDNRSGYKGVTWNKSARKWMAVIVRGGKRYYLGVFGHKVRAAFAHDRAVLALDGEHAGLNFADLRERITPVMPSPSTPRRK